MKAYWVIVLFAVAMILAFVGGRCSVNPTPSPEAPLPDPRLDPPDTVRITKHQWHIVEDSSWRQRYDSLLAAQGGNPDTTVKYLGTPWEEKHRWRIDRPEVGFLAAGDLNLVVDPVAKETKPVEMLDTLRLPPPQIRTEYKETISIPWLIAAFGVGAAAGIWAGSR